MNKYKPFITLLWTSLVVGLIGGRLSSQGCAEPASTSTATNAVEAKAGSPSVAPAGSHLTGAELYSIHCNRCHPERYPTERTAAQWKTIMLHMQVRANIPAKQSRLILQYLQENSGR